MILMDAYKQHHFENLRANGIPNQTIRYPYEESFHKADTDRENGTNAGMTVKDRLCESSANAQRPACSIIGNWAVEKPHPYEVDSQSSDYSTNLARSNSYSSSGYASCDYITTAESEIDALLMSRDSEDDVSSVLSTDLHSLQMLVGDESPNPYEMILRIDKAHRAAATNSPHAPDQTTGNSGTSNNKTVSYMKPTEFGVNYDEPVEEEEPVYLSIDDLCAESTPVERFDPPDISLAFAFESQKSINRRGITASMGSLSLSNGFEDQDLSFGNVQDSLTLPNRPCIDDFCEICSPSILKQTTPVWRSRQHNSINGYYKIDREDTAEHLPTTALRYHIPEHLNSNSKKYMTGTSLPQKKVRFLEDVQEITYDQPKMYSSEEFKVSIRRLTEHLPDTSRIPRADSCSSNSMFGEVPLSTKSTVALRTELQYTL